MNRAEQIRAALPRLTELERLELERALHDELDARCGEVKLTPVKGCPDCFEASESVGCLFWLQNLTMTTDDHWQTKGTPAKAPFPKKDYLRFLFGMMLRLLAFPERKRDSLFVAKSRDILCSWSVMGFVTWFCQWRPQTFWICQSAKEDKAAELVKYAHTLWHNQAGWLQERHPLRTDNLLDMVFENGSRILGVPAGADQIRIHHPHGYFADEAAFLPNFEDCYNAVLPVAAQIIAVSTAAPSRFMDFCEPDGATSDWQSASAEVRKDESEPECYPGPSMQIRWEEAGGRKAEPKAEPEEPVSGASAHSTGGVRHMTADGRPEVFRG